ncbi:PREDICTED: uncharacterized protein LOC109167303 [Ipomoea nil]|uniref:uncharacterized protein LOC109167303 n=1 Tax=Ipomoea nil TaxID=35883 RepID=UPI0009017AE0|nr:PREDICTED: uncharacterized protein LOC109167303 [Ipomoea nil]
MEDDEETEIILRLSKTALISSSYHEISNAREVKRLMSALAWLFLDQSNLWRAGLSWSLFFILTIGVPLVSYLVFSCDACDSKHQRPFNAIVQLSLSVFATISFISLSCFARRYGVRKFLFLDRLCEENDKVQQGYTLQIHSSLKILASFVLPTFLADCAYKIWWFVTGGGQIPYFYNMILSNVVICILLLSSWLYRIAISFLVCVLFRLICHLQILRLDGFAQVFEKESEVSAILIEHLRIRRNLRVISHRFRLFILSTLIVVTASQFVSLLVTTESKSHAHIFAAAELGLCSMIMVTGLFICLRSAAKITHKAQSVASLAAKWHACATLSSFDEFGDETPVDRTGTGTPQAIHPVDADWENDDEEGDGDDELDNTNMVPVHAHTISYHKRQALVTYFEHNKAGITVYGFMLDRTWLHTIFVIQLSLTLWILNKTIGIS